MLTFLLFLAMVKQGFSMFCKKFLGIMRSGGCALRLDLRFLLQGVETSVRGEHTPPEKEAYQVMSILEREGGGTVVRFF